MRTVMNGGNPGDVFVSLPAAAGNATHQILRSRVCLKSAERRVLHCNFPLGKEKPVIFRGIFRESKEGRRSGVFIFVFEKRIGFFK